MNILQRAALLAAIGVAAIVAAGAYTTAPDAQAALGGPVILGGDDLTDHGCATGGVNEQGWLYLQRALENIKPNVTRSNDGSIAALGSAAVEGVVCDNAGSAILSAATAPAVGLTVNYHNGEPAITAFFAALASGSARPAIIWIAGTGASNDLDDVESDALTANAAAISSFVSSGGGLMSHGTAYGWLTALLPGATTVNNGSSGDLFFTPEGLTALPVLTVADINAGPWHNYFEGDFGGLQVLVRSRNRLDSVTGGPAAVVLGGAQVTFEKNPATPPPAEPTATPAACIPPLVGIICTAPPSGGGSGSGAKPTATAVASTPAPASTVAAATVVPAAPTRVSQPLGVIVAPDTGDGSGTAGGSSATLTLLILAASGVAVAGAGALKLQRRRD